MQSLCKAITYMNCHFMSLIKWGSASWYDVVGAMQSL